jgi:hypothetical protein
MAIKLFRLYNDILHVFGFDGGRKEKDAKH